MLIKHFGNLSDRCVCGKECNIIICPLEESNIIISLLEKQK